MPNLRHNETIDTLLNRRSIRAFCNEAIDENTVATLETVAQRAACSQFLNDWSAIKITDSSIKQKLSEIGNQMYIATAPLLYVFIIDQHRNAAIARKNGVDADTTNLCLKLVTALLKLKMTLFWRFTQWKLLRNLWGLAV